MIVRVANAENSTPRSGSNRRAAIHQAERGHLHQVVERLAAVAETAGELARQPEVLGDQLLALVGVQSVTMCVGAWCAWRLLRRWPGGGHCACSLRRLWSHARTAPSSL